MNLRHSSLLLAIFLGAAVSVGAQSPSTTGTVMALSRDAGSVTVMPGGSQRPAYFRDMKRARFVFADGRRASFDHLDEGQIVTVQYTRRGDRWYVGEVVLPNNSGGRAYPGMPPEGLTPAQRRATTSSTLTDRDITTQPAGNATFDRDITTQPGSKATTDRDITTQPGSKATTDRDITTQPGSKARIDRDITTQPGKTNPRTNTDITKRPDNR